MAEDGDEEKKRAGKNKNIIKAIKPTRIEVGKVVYRGKRKNKPWTEWREKGEIKKCK